MSLRWSWNDFWQYFEQLESEQEKTDAIRELMRDGWLERLTVENQVIVMSPAPLYILQAMKNSPNTFKQQTIMTIEYNMNKKAGRRK